MCAGCLALLPIIVVGVGLVAMVVCAVRWTEIERTIMVNGMFDKKCAAEGNTVKSMSFMPMRCILLIFFLVQFCRSFAHAINCENHASVRTHNRLINSLSRASRSSCRHFSLQLYIAAALLPCNR